MTETMTVTSADDTKRVGQLLAPLLAPGDLILLDGDLGAGKTTFTKGLAEGLGIKRPVKSPTFTIIREYQEGRLPLYHMDVYRLEDGSGSELGLDEYFNGDGVSVVEWSTFVADELSEEYLKMSFKRLDESGSEVRQLTFSPEGERFTEMLKRLMEALADD